MRAAVTPRYGNTTVLEIQEVPRPQVAPDQVLVAVDAAAVTAGDLRLRAADFPSFSAVIGRAMLGVLRPRHPVQGTMFAGRVVEVGAAVTDYAIGDAVFGSVDHGAYAELLAVKADGPIAHLPAGVDPVAAAEVPYGAVTAWRFLHDMARIQPGEQVLILGASGGVGRYAIQIARHLGAEVTAVCSARNFDRVRALGAQHVIDYRTTDFTEGAARYDVVFDIADATRFGRCRHVLRAGGRYLTVYMSVGVLLRALTTRWGAGPRAHFGIALATRDDMQVIAGLLREGALRSTVGHRFPLDAIAEAHALAEATTDGGVVVRVASASADQGGVRHDLHARAEAA